MRLTLGVEAPFMCVGGAGAAARANETGINGMNDNRRMRALSGDGHDLAARMTYSDEEREAVHKQKVRLAKRAAKGKDWDGKADNDNINWPLATSLVREGNTELLKTAMAYRRIYDSANSGAQLGGTKYTPKEGKVIDYVSQLDESTGHIEYGKARKSNSVEAVASTPARRKNITNETTISDSSPVPKPWNGDRPVNDMIDSCGKLAAIRTRLGYLVEPLEMAVVGNATYREVGNAAGVANRKGAEGAGRALIHTALITARDSLGDIRREDIVA